jgi:hypothetical protein
MRAMGYVFLAFILLVGPLAYFFGADSRYGVTDRRGWWPGAPHADR